MYMDCACFVSVKVIAVDIKNCNRMKKYKKVLMPPRNLKTASVRYTPSTKYVLVQKLVTKPISGFGVFRNYPEQS